MEVSSKRVYARELTDDRQLARRRPIDVDDQVHVIVAAAPQADLVEVEVGKDNLVAAVNALEIRQVAVVDAVIAVT